MILNEIIMAAAHSLIGTIYSPLVASIYIPVYFVFFLILNKKYDFLIFRYAGFLILINEANFFVSYWNDLKFETMVHIILLGGPINLDA